MISGQIQTGENNCTKRNNAEHYRVINEGKSRKIYSSLKDHKRNESLEDGKNKEQNGSDGQEKQE